MTEIVSKIIEKKVDYIFVVKGNQKQFEKQSDLIRNAKRIAILY